MARARLDRTALHSPPARPRSLSCPRPQPPSHPAPLSTRARGCCARHRCAAREPACCCRHCCSAVGAHNLGWRNLQDVAGLAGHAALDHNRAALGVDPEHLHHAAGAAAAQQQRAAGGCVSKPLAARQAGRALRCMPPALRCMPPARPLLRLLPLRRRTCRLRHFLRTAPMWPAILRPGKVRPGVVPGPVLPCSRWLLEPCVMAPRFMP